MNWDELILQLEKFTVAVSITGLLLIAYAIFYMHIFNSSIARFGVLFMFLTASGLYDINKTKKKRL